MIKDINNFFKSFYLKDGLVQFTAYIGKIMKEEALTSFTVDDVYCFVLYLAQ